MEPEGLSSYQIQYRCQICQIKKQSSMFCCQLNYIPSCFKTLNIDLGQGLKVKEIAFIFFLSFFILPFFISNIIIKVLFNTYILFVFDICVQILLGMKKISLITGNINKRLEYENILGKYYQITTHDIDLTQIQGEPDDIINHKVTEAFKLLKSPVIVEDTSLCMKSYNNMPGPFVKWFLKSVGPQGLYSMASAHIDRSAFALCKIGFMSNLLQKPLIVEGKKEGNIVEPRGEQNFGWDCIFEPQGFNKTYAEMKKQEKNRVSHRFIAILELKKRLSTLQDQKLF